MTVDELVDDVLAACTADGGLRDDLAVLAVRDEPAGPGRFRALVPAIGRELGPLRRSLRSWLLDQGVEGSAADDLVLAMSEAATNAIEHAYRHGTGLRELVSVSACVEEPGHVRVEIRDAGLWKPYPSGTARGRGLAIVRSLLGGIDIRTGPSGTTVTFGWEPPRTTAR